MHDITKIVEKQQQQTSLKKQQHKNKRTTKQAWKRGLALAASVMAQFQVSMNNYLYQVPITHQSGVWGVISLAFFTFGSQKYN